MWHDTLFDGLKISAYGCRKEGSVGFENAFPVAYRAPPRTPLGELTTLPQTPSRLGGDGWRGHPPRASYFTPLASILPHSALVVRRLGFREHCPQTFSSRTAPDTTL